MKEETADWIHNLFFSPPEKISSRQIILSGDTVHHLKNVLRKKIGDVVFITDGQGNRYKTEIVEIERSKIIAEILDKKYIPQKGSLNLGLAFVPLKGTRNEFIIEKGTELGVRIFFPFISRFSVVRRLNQKKIERFKKIARGAMLQSRQYHLPHIVPCGGLDGLIEKFQDFAYVCVADMSGGDEIPLFLKSLLYIVGPEGGFTPDEITQFQNGGVGLLNLGENRLRSETAAIAGICKILAAYRQI